MMFTMFESGLYSVFKNELRLFCSVWCPRFGEHVLLWLIGLYS